MKIVANTIPLLSPLTGVGQYIFHTISYLDTILDITYYYGYYSKKVKYNPYPKTKKVIDKIPYLKKILRKSFNLMHIGKEFDLYWEPNFIPLENIKAKKIITTVHDLSFHFYPQWHPKERIDYFMKNFYKNIYKSNRIICGTHTIKKEIIQELNIDAENIEVIPYGINHNKFYKNDKTRNPDKKFILFVGSIEPRKNLLRLLKAYIALPTYLKKEYKLLLVGFSGWNNQEILSLISRNSGDIYYKGYVSDKELATLYNQATFFVYPSLYEGFGIPPLEAMACGCAVITSNIPTICEVCKDAAFFIDPLNIESILNGLKIVLENEHLRSDLEVKGLKKAKEFSWQKSALEHKRIFQAIC